MSETLLLSSVPGVTCIVLARHINTDGVHAESTTTFHSSCLGSIRLELQRCSSYGRLHLCLRRISCDLTYSLLLHCAGCGQARTLHHFAGGVGVTNGIAPGLVRRLHSISQSTSVKKLPRQSMDSPVAPESGGQIPLAAARPGRPAGYSSYQERPAHSPSF